MVTLFFCSLLKYTEGLRVYWLSVKQLIFLTFYLKTNKVRNQIYTKLTVKTAITKLQKAMGHSSINVSLTYLRALEIAELKEEDMPMVNLIKLVKIK